MKFLFDILIFGFLVSDGIVIFLIARGLLKYRKNRAVLRATVSAVLIFAWLVIFYGSFIEPQLITVNNISLELSKNTTEELRVALLSDFHVGPFKKAGYVKRVVEKIRSEIKPDVIFIAGDFIFGDPLPDELNPLKNLQAPMGVYAVLGNHDYGEYSFKEGWNGDETKMKMVKEKLESLGIRVLVNEEIRLTIGKKNVSFFGADEYTTGRARLPDSAPDIVVSHSPDIVREAAKTGVKLVLAGHTHGGQIRLPWLGAVPKIPDTLGDEYDRGLFQYGSSYLFITSGIGESGPRARLFAPPEIAVLKIQF